MRHTLAPRKNLGQHFLADDVIARKIAAAIAPQPEDIIVEIGAGEGALTRLLVHRAKKIIAIELDDRAVAVLRETFGDDVTLLHADALTVSLRALAHQHGEKIRVVGNIPYQITSPLLFHLFEEADAVRNALFMMQREVADRLVAQPRTKSYGILSVMTQFYSVPKKLFTVAPGSFFPPPKVVSAVIALDMQHTPHDIVDEPLFRRIVRATFAKRRKILSNGLQEIVQGDPQMKIIGATIDLSRRPEELSVAEFIALTNVVAGAAAR